jgi:hypothetical protein
MSKFFKIVLRTFKDEEEHFSYSSGQLSNVWDDFQSFKNFNNVKSIRVLVRSGTDTERYIELDRWVRSKLEDVTGHYVDSYNRNSPIPAVGSTWIWEKGKPHAEERITVASVNWNGREYWVNTVTVGTSDVIPNDLSRFWEAVTPVES